MTNTKVILWVSSKPQGFSYGIMQLMFYGTTRKVTYFSVVNNYKALTLSDFLELDFSNLQPGSL